MGSNLDTRTYKDMSRDDLSHKFAADCEEARYMSGHGGYSGTIAEMNGIARYVDQAFEQGKHTVTVDYDDETGKDIVETRDMSGREAAYEYMVEHHQKWEDAMAVSFMRNGAKHWLVGGWCSS